MHVEYGEIDSDYVFVNLFRGRIGEPLTYAASTQLARRIVARTGISFTPHVLRHSHASAMVRQGVPIEVVAKLLTHRSSTTTSSTYVHLDVADIRAALVKAGVSDYQSEAASEPGVGRHPGRSCPPVRAGRRPDRARRRVGRRSVAGRALRRSGPAGTRAWSASTASPRTGCARRSSAGPGSVWPPAAPCPTISAGALALGRFCRFLTEAHPEVADPAGITRAVLEDFLAWLLAAGLLGSTRALTCSMIRVFFDACHRHGWLPGLAPAATIYVDELPFHHQDLARFIPEFVMAQIESEAALAQLRPVTARNLLVLIIETGLRKGDACNLAFNPVDRRLHRLAVPALRCHQDPSRAAGARSRPPRPRPSPPNRTTCAACLPAGSPWLFPGIVDNADGSKPYSHSYSPSSCGTGATASACTTRPASPSGVTPTSSATPSGPA